MAKSVKLYDRSGQEVWPKVSLSGVYNGGTSMSGISSGKLVKGPNGFVYQSDIHPRVGASTGVSFGYSTLASLKSSALPFDVYSRVNGGSFTLECLFSVNFLLSSSTYGLFGLTSTTSGTLPSVGLCVHSATDGYVAGVYGVVNDGAAIQYAGPVFPDLNFAGTRLVHVSVDRSSKTVTFYADGASVGSATYTSDLSFSEWLVSLGGFTGSAIWGVNCFRVFSGSFSAADAESRFNAGYLPALLLPETGYFAATTLIEYIPSSIRQTSNNGLIWANLRGSADLVSTSQVYLSYAELSDERTLEVGSGLFTTNIASGVANKDIILPYGYVPMWAVVRSYGRSLTNVSVQVVGSAVYCMYGASVAADTSVYASGFYMGSDGSFSPVGVLTSSDSRTTVRVNASGNGGDSSTLSTGMSVTVGCKFIGQ